MMDLLVAVRIYLTFLIFIYTHRDIQTYKKAYGSHAHKCIYFLRVINYRLHLSVFKTDELM